MTEGAASGPIRVSLRAAGRLAVAQQRLAGPLPRRAGKEEILSVIRDLAYVQWDPVSIVAPSHLLSLWSRIGSFRPSLLEELLWEQKSVLEHWTPIASLVLTEDYPLFRSLMRRYPASLTRSWGAQGARAQRFLAQHVGLRRKLLRELAGGPRTMSEFQDHARTRRNEGAWTPESDVAEMLFHLAMQGEAMVVGRQGTQNLWGLTSEFLPPRSNRRALSPEELERAAAQRAIRALGTATPREINYYFVRGRYEHLGTTLRGLEAEGSIHRVDVEGSPRKEERYVHDRDLARLASVEQGDWSPRLSLLPPFDNLICSQSRTQRLFGFDYVREQFLPEAKRRYGTYVLPILWGERLIGRIDPRLDKAARKLVVNAVFAEPGAPQGREMGSRIGAAIRDLAGFVGATAVEYRGRVPPAWAASLR